MKGQIDSHSIRRTEIEESFDKMNYLHNAGRPYFCVLCSKNRLKRSADKRSDNSAEYEKYRFTEEMPLSSPIFSPVNPDKLELQISGMNCAGCVLRIEKRLSKIHGVNYVKVSFGTKKATIIYDLSQLDCFDLVRAISELGYRTRTQRVILPLKGISRAFCAKKIRAALRKIPGVIAANINGATGKAVIMCISGQVSIEDLARSIEKAGNKTWKIAEDRVVDK